jgi:prepilin-type N-terminal cleavage/methylation domain-containing protein
MEIGAIRHVLQECAMRSIITVSSPITARARAAAPRSGFTLIELLVVIAIIITLIGLLMPLIAMLKNSEKAATTRSNIMGLMVAMQAYADEDPRHFFPTPQADEHLSFVEGSTTAALTLLTRAGYTVPMQDIDHETGPTSRMLMDGWWRPILYRLDGPFMSGATIDSSRMNGIADRPAPTTVVDDWNPKGIEPYPYIWSLGKPKSGDATDALPASAIRWIYKKGLK